MPEAINVSKVGAPAPAGNRWRLAIPLVPSAEALGLDEADTRRIIDAELRLAGWESTP